MQAPPVDVDYLLLLWSNLNNILKFLRHACAIIGLSNFTRSNFVFKPTHVNYCSKKKQREIGDGMGGGGSNYCSC